MKILIYINGMVAKANDEITIGQQTGHLVVAHLPNELIRVRFKDGTQLDLPPEAIHATWKECEA